MSSVKPAPDDVVLMRVVGSKLVPVDSHDEDAVRRFRNGTIVEVRLHQEPYQPELRWANLYFSAVAKVLGLRRDKLLFDLKRSLGKLSHVEQLGDQSLIRMKSLREMGGPELREFVFDAQRIIEQELLPGMSPEEIIAKSKEVPT